MIMPSEKDYLEKWIESFTAEIDRFDRLKEEEIPAGWPALIESIRSKREELQQRLNQIKTMKATPKQIEMLKLIKSQIQFFIDSNDIGSPSHLTDMDEVVATAIEDFDLDAMEVYKLRTALLYIYSLAIKQK